MPIGNPRGARHSFLEGLHEDGYFPDHVVDEGWTILLALCPDVEELIATREW